MAIESVGFKFNSSVNYRNYLPLKAPMILADYVIGNASSSTYRYKISSANNDGESELSDEILITNGPTSLSSSNYIRLIWDEVEYAEYYKVYKFSGGQFKFLTNVITHWHFDDIGLLSVSDISNSGNTSGYDSNSVNLGYLMRRYQGSSDNLNFVSPILQYFHTGYHSGMNNVANVMQIERYTKNYDIVYCINSSNSQSLAIFLNDRKTLTFHQVGVLYFPFLTTNCYIYNALYSFEKSSQGYVTVSGNTVTGVNTLFDTLRFSVGARIGFGSTNPLAITEWYEVAVINSDTSITLLETLTKTYPANCPYIIEEIQVFMGVLHNSSPFNLGGLFIAKGLNLGCFRQNFTIPMATTLDRIRATYRLVDSIASNTVTYGKSITYAPKISQTEQLAYLGVGDGTMNIFVFNTRAPLSLTSGAAQNAYLFKTATYDCPNNFNGFRYICMSHGPGKNIPSLYATMAQYTYRIPIYSIKPNQTYIIADGMRLHSKYGYFTMGQISGQSGFYYSQNLDRITYSTTYCGITKYNGNAIQDQKFFGSNDQAYSDYRMIYSKNESYFTIGNNYVPGYGVWYYNREYKVACFAAEADWEYAERNKARIITPSIHTSFINKFKKLLISHPEVIYDDFQGIVPEPFRVYYRIEGINDDSGTWILLNDTWDLSLIVPGDKIQFMFEFKILGEYGVPARIYSLEISYETDEELPNGIEWNLNDSNNALGIIGFEQTASLSTYNGFKIAFYNLDTDQQVFSASSAENTNGTFQYWNGSSWVSGIGLNIFGTRRRFLPNHSFVYDNVYPKLILL
jgi:hypothetical protein